MKLRTGFVSNSSSSSFLVMYNEDSRLVLKSPRARKGRHVEDVAFRFEDFLRLAEAHDSCDTESTCVKADGYDSVMDYLTETGSFGLYSFDESYVEKTTKMLRSNHRKFAEAAYIQIVYSDKMVRKILKAFVDSGEVLLVDGDDRVEVDE